MALNLSAFTSFLSFFWQALLCFFSVYTWGSQFPHFFPKTKNSDFRFRAKTQVNLKFRVHNQWTKWHIASWSPLLAVFCRTAPYLAIKWARVCFELFASLEEHLWLSIWLCDAMYTDHIVWFGKKPNRSVSNNLLSSECIHIDGINITTVLHLLGSDVF